MIFNKHRTLRNREGIRDGTAQRTRIPVARLTGYPVGA